MATLQPQITLEQRLAAGLAMQRFSPANLETMRQLARQNTPLPTVRANLQKLLKGWSSEIDNAMVVIEYLRAGGDE